MDRSRGENKKMVIKIGGGGIGLGAVALFATAALASFFAVRRSSKIDKDQTDIREEEEDTIEMVNYAKLDDKAMVESDGDDIVIIKKEIPSLDDTNKKEVEEGFCNGNGDTEMNNNATEKEEKVDDDINFVSKNTTPLLPLFEGEEEEEEEEDDDEESDSKVVQNVVGGEVEGPVMKDLINDSSKWEALWQAEAPQLINYEYEVGGKTEEDHKYGAAVELGTATNYSSLLRWRMIVWTISVFSSLSCSWFFNLSLANFSLLLFFTAFLLEIYGYSLLNPHHAHSLLAAKEDHKIKPTPTNKLANL